VNTVACTQVAEGGLGLAGRWEPSNEHSGNVPGWLAGTVSSSVRKGVGAGPAASELHGVRLAQAALRLSGNSLALYDRRHWALPGARSNL
jgi:hypothetical protein